MSYYFILLTIFSIFFFLINKNFNKTNYNIIFNLITYKKYIFSFSLTLFFINCLYLIFYDPFQFNNNYLFNLNFLNSNFYFGIDGISIFFVFLTTFLIPCCILYS